MAHEFESGLFVGQPAWHGLGTVLDAPPSVEEALSLAGLDWSVKLAPLAVAADGREVDHFASIRESDNTVLGVVGPGYVPLQNRDAFAWFQPLVESGVFQIEAAGSLRNGKRIWILARPADACAEVVSGDEIRQYLLLAHGHDGSLAIRCGFTAVRVVCANTLAGALCDRGSKLVRIHHRAHAQEALEGVRELVQAARADFAALFERLVVLAGVDCDDARLRQYAREVFAPGSDDPEAAPRIVAQVAELFESGRGTDIAGVRGTLWGAYNAITEFTSHVRCRSADARVESQWFGDSAVIAQRALEVALRFAASA